MNGPSLELASLHVKEVSTSWPRRGHTPAPLPHPVLDPGPPRQRRSLAFIFHQGHLRNPDTRPSDATQASSLAVQSPPSLLESGLQGPWPHGGCETAEGECCDVGRWARRRPREAPQARIPKENVPEVAYCPPTTPHEVLA